MNSTAIQCTVAPTQQEQATGTPAFVFKGIEMPQYLEYWLTSELGYQLKIVELNPNHKQHSAIFDRAFPGQAMGRHTYLVKIDSEEGIEFLGQHQPIQGSSSLVHLTEDEEIMNLN